MDPVAQKRRELLKEKPSFDLLAGSPSVTVKVGLDAAAQYWNLPQALLIHVSQFFRVALNPPWTESQTQTIELKEDSPAAFDLFVKWMYTWMSDINNKPPSYIPVNFGVMVGLHAWILGDKLGCVLYQDYALAIICWSENDEITTADFIRQAYARSPAGSMLRQLAACALTWWIRKIEPEELAEDPLLPLLNEVDDLAIDMVKIDTLRKHKSRIPYFMASRFDDYVFQDGIDEDLGEVINDAMADASR